MRWYDVSRYCTDRKRTRNHNYFLWVRSKHKAKVELEMFQKVRFT